MSRWKSRVEMLVGGPIHGIQLYLYIYKPIQDAGIIFYVAPRTEKAHNWFLFYNHWLPLIWRYLLWGLGYFIITCSKSAVSLYILPPHWHNLFDKLIFFCLSSEAICGCLRWEPYKGFHSLIPYVQFGEKMTPISQSNLQIGCLAPHRIPVHGEMSQMKSASLCGWLHQSCEWWT